MTACLTAPTPKGRAPGESVRPLFHEVQKGFRTLNFTAFVYNISSRNNVKSRKELKEYGKYFTSI